MFSRHADPAFAHLQVSRRWDLGMWERYGQWIVISVDEARQMARGLLAAELPRRWAHVQGVARRAEMSGLVVGDESQLVTAAAWLHDVGYTSGLVVTGFHPIDGARWLRRRGVDERVVGLVAHHSCAHVEARLRGLLPVLEAEFPRDDSLPHDELCFCDQTTGPDGQLVTVEDRLAEIRERYGPSHVVIDFIDEAGPELVRIVRRVEARITAAGETSQPR